MDDLGALVLPRAVWHSLDERLRRVERTLQRHQCEDDRQTITQLRLAMQAASIGGDVSLL